MFPIGILKLKIVFLKCFCSFTVAGICYGKKCHRNAVCVNYNCVCKPGFIGDGYHNCQSKALWVISCVKRRG